ncbi:hypothetical protein VD0002_g3454 [Verticillium dahliae]|nr:hypothetical protein VD0002_g3454 [Verticillium dahliae]
MPALPYLTAMSSSLLRPSRAHPVDGHRRPAGPLLNML